MSIAHFSRTIAATFALLSSLAVSAEPVNGITGSGSDVGWQAAWLNLKTPTSFKKGDKLVIKVEGMAENILVRLLPASGDPSYPVGIEGKARKIPADRFVVITLERDYPDVRQISLHGGPSAWSISLGANNGAVAIVSIEKAAK